MARMKAPPMAGDVPTCDRIGADAVMPVSYTHLRAHETVLDLVCRLLLEKKKSKRKTNRALQVTKRINIRQRYNVVHIVRAH